MKNLYFPLFFFCAMSLSAQTIYNPNPRYWEPGVFLGAVNYSGDVAEKNIHFSETRLGYGAFTRYFLSKKFALRANLYGGSIAGDDANSKDPGLRSRSFRFSTKILELAVGGEWHMWAKDRYSDTGIHQHFTSPYLFLGAGGVFTSVKVEYNGAPKDRNTFVVAPLPEKKSRQQFLIPIMGMGVRTDINENLVLGAEIGMRPMLSDYLDGVSVNGNPGRKDWYYFGGATLSYILSKPKALN
ncbi:MAG: DUF6089 family protein [Saprospiraceae bacterium]|nr:DUF6089 family protein [Saprospiraceae bacterium]